VGAATLEVRREAAGEGWRLTITNTGPEPAMFIWLEDERPLGAEGYVYFSDNHFSLFPGEAHTVTVEWDNVPAGERRLTVAGWNTPSLTVTP
jgi:beta-mannosidase